ncbi:hypothetical protein [Ekhidna sp. To15]|uniref:hypothetical protein n=1 Tax=Ekhidna sp. To15 TaxID=3395267 RepID=UPI003F524174
MDRSFLYLEYSGWWLLPIVILAASLSYFLYSKKNVPWNSSQNWVLAAIRFLGIFSLLALLLSPSIRKVTNRVEDPVVALAVDNSQSVVQRGNSKEDILEIIRSLEEGLDNQDIDVELVTFNDSSDFNYSTSNLSSLIKRIDDVTDQRHFVGSILITDGIYNRGSSPLYKNYVTPIFTIGLGDTIPPKDASISRVLYNKVTYKGNETPIRLEISQEGFTNREIFVQLKEKGELIAEQKIRLRSSIQEVEFVLKSEEEGLRRLVASISNLGDESTLENNRSNIFMEIIDGRQQVLIVANAPHPDIKAIRSTLAETGNYRTEVYIPQIHDEKPNEVFDVVIFHGAFTSGINFTPKENPGTWYILSNESSITSANRTLPFIKIERRGSQPDKVVGSFNQNFSKYKIEDVSAFEEYPPVEVPFGNYSISGPTEILMYQKLGSVKTQKPLMVVFDDGTQKSAVLLGQNIWKWKLQEAAINGNADQFKNLITKTVQFLSVKNDKKQFRFKSRVNNFTDSEPALFDVEVYNDIYERIYGSDIYITITSENGAQQNFTFTDSELNNTFRAPSFSPGIYQYQARVQIGDKTLTDRGEFSVQDINPEFTNLTADHRLLKNLSNNSGGTYMHFNQADQILSIIDEMDFKSIIKSEENFIPLNRAWWWYLIIFSLFSGEWFLRKFWGGY